MKLYQKIANTILAINNCKKSNNTEWLAKHEQELRNLETSLPSGSGFDAGTIIDIANCKNGKVMLLTDFHHMDDHGGYTNWTTHQITIRPSLAFGFELKISGRNQNNVKDYISECFEYDLSQEVTQ